MCPQNAELYLLAARMELSSNSKDTSPPGSCDTSAPSSHDDTSAPSSHSDVTSAMRSAVGWLESCIRAFYKIPNDAQDSELTIETALLFRYTLYCFDK